MPDTELDKPMIVNWALAELGQTPNFSLSAETRLGAIVDIFWPRTVARSFGLADWPFCRRTYKLTRQAGEPATGYSYGFDLPRPRFGAPVKYLEDPRSDRPVRHTRIEGETVFANVPTLFAVCKVEVDPSTWDEQFADAFAVALAANLAVPLLQDIELAADRERRAFGTPQEGGTGGIFGRLAAQHRASGPVSSPLDADALSGGRPAGPWFGRW